jgi:anti-sigma factor RsiW
MNDPTLIGPCAEYEYEIVDLQDGGLLAGRARAVLAHLDGCPRCRAWADELAALDAGLAATLPRPALSPDFDARLRERIESLVAPARRGELRSRLEQEHDSLIESLRRAARRRAVLGAIGSAAATLSVFAAAPELLAKAGGLLPAFGEGADRWMQLGGLGAAIAIAAIAWSAVRGGLPGLGALR